MNWKCFFGCTFVEIGRHAVRLIEKEGEIPTGHETRFLMRCTKCNDTKTKVVEGWFGKDDEDDEDDDKDPPPTPVLTPDDYYASL